MRVALYFNHIQTLGHTTRSLMLAKGLQEHGAEVLVLQGGLPQKYMALRKELNLIDLPKPFTSKAWLMGNKSAPLVDIKERIRFMKKELDAFKPDIFITEFFPFGRPIERFELVPLIQYLKKKGTKIVGSAGYPVLSGSQEFTERYLVHYDTMLIHAVKELDLAMLKNITSDAYGKFFEQEKMVFTGYLAEKTQKVEKQALKEKLGCAGRKLVLCSRGGGIILPQIIYKTMLAAKQLPDFYFLVVAGAASSKKELAIAKKLAQDNVKLLAYTEHFYDYLAAADISVSMCGYNTSCEILQLKKKAVLVPLYYKHMPEEIEQSYRAKILENILKSKTILPEELTTENLAAAIKQQHAAPQPQPDLKASWFAGMKNTIRILEAL